MQIRKGTNRAEKSLEVFRSKLTSNVQPVDHIEVTENELHERLFESMFARIQRLEEELEQRQQARSGFKPGVAAWHRAPIAEQDQDVDQQRTLQKAIASYEQVSRFDSSKN